MCNASDKAVGAVLGQRTGGVPYAICYASQTLDHAQRHYTPTEKELYAIVFALEKFRPYLLGVKVVILSNYAALKALLKKNDFKPKPIRWVILLQEFDIKIVVDRPGAQNLVADI